MNKRQESITLIFGPLGLGSIVLVLAAVRPISLTGLGIMAAVLCWSAFILTAVLRLRKERREHLEQQNANQRIVRAVTAPTEAPIEEWIPEESPAVVLGAGGIYGIVYGLGITDALGDYAKLLSSTISHYLPNAPLSLLGMVGLVLPNTFRLLGFLVTVVPFIHGAMLTFSNRWYYEKQNKKYHFGLAFIFFILVFIHTILFYFVALNILDISLFLLLLWIIMILNSPWLLVQRWLTTKYIGRNDYFLNEWILINFNTFAFLSVFIFASSDIFSGNNNLGADLELNLIILIVLISRSITDYIVGWKSVYNRLPGMAKK